MAKYALLTAVAVGGLLTQSALQTPASATEPGTDLAPHRAVYNLALVSASQQVSLTSVRGRLVFEFRGSSCAGYTTNTRFVMAMTDKRGRETVIDVRSSTWEDGKADRFRFHSTKYVNEKIDEAVSGSAERKADDGAVTVQLTKPNKSEHTLASNIMFPTEHTFAVLAAARRGETLVQADLFDGTDDGAKVFALTAVLGKSKPPGEGATLAKVENAEVLDRLPSWPVSLSYYDKEAGDGALPSYELDFRLYANGVHRDLRLNYGKFVVGGKMASLEFLDAIACN